MRGICTTRNGCFGIQVVLGQIWPLSAAHIPRSTSLARILDWNLDLTVPTELPCFVLQRQAALCKPYLLPLGVGHGGGLASQNGSTACWAPLEHISACPWCYNGVSQNGRYV